MKVQIIYTWFVSADEIQNWEAAVLWTGDKGEPLSKSTDPPRASFDLFFMIKPHLLESCPDSRQWLRRFPWEC